MTPFALLLHFIKERESIRLKKEAGLPPPWTTDEILGRYRFTNVNREDDKVTKWVAQWRRPDDPDMWFAMAVARHVNLPDTLALMGYPVPWNPEAFLVAIRSRKARGIPAYNAAYMIRAARGSEFGDKAAYLAEAVLGPMWGKRVELRPKIGDLVEDFYNRLVTCYGMGSFLAAQVAADVKQVYPLYEAPDRWTFAASGPGSRRGLNRILGREPTAPWREAEWRVEFAKLYECLVPYMDRGELPRVDASCIQNTLCEISKYAKAYYNEGRPKQRYVPA